MQATPSGPRDTPQLRAVAPLLDTQAQDLSEGDVILLCSDGLSEMVEANDIAATLQKDEPVEIRAQALIDQAKAGGGRDNVSVIVIQAGEATGKPGLLARFRKK